MTNFDTMTWAIDEEDINKAKHIVDSACKKLLSNETIEEYKFKLVK